MQGLDRTDDDARLGAARPALPAARGARAEIAAGSAPPDVATSVRGVALAQSIRARKRALFRDLTRLLSIALDYEDGESRYHGLRVAVLARALARKTGEEEGTALFGGLLHDLGAFGLKEHVIHHAHSDFADPDARLHPSRSAGLVRPLASLRALEATVAHHHERWDGQGFPAGLQGLQIPPSAAIVALADVLELSLRRSDPAERRARGVAVARALRGTYSPPGLVEAALGLFDDDPALLDDLFDAEALARRYAAADLEPVGLDAMTEPELLGELLWLVARVVDAKHDFTAGHSARVALHAQRIALALADAVDPWEVVWTALLHDVGKVSIPRRVLDKAGPLDDAELRSVRAQPDHTAEIVGSLGSLSQLALAASSAHEAYDGSGYPRGLAGEAIPLVARVVAYANVFDALRSDRAFRGGMAPDEALATMRTLVGTLLDPSLAQAAFASLARHPEVGATASDLLGFQQFFRVDEDARATLGARPEGDSELADAARCCTAELTPEGAIVGGATELAALSGVTADGFLEHFAEHARGRLCDELRRVARGETLATTHPTPSGVALEILVGPARGSLVAHVRSASRLWRSMHELALVHRNYLLSSEAVTFTDERARIVDVNHAFTRMFGWRPDEVVGLTPRFLQSGKHAPSLYREMRESLIDPQVGAWSGEIVNKTKTGELVAVQLTVNSVRDSAGRVVGYVSSAHDVTARRRAQEALEERERDLRHKNGELERLNRFKSQMVAITSHDLRSPLAAMIGLAEVLQESDPDRDHLRAQLGLLADAGHRLVGLVDDLLDLDKCESGTLELRPRRLQAHGLLGSIAGSVLERGRVIVAPSRRDLRFVGDAERLEQALSNLVGNALKYSEAPSPVEIGFDEIDARIRFWVADRGPGIPDGALEAVFDRYVQVEREGSSPSRGAGIGLGLAIVRHVAELHGGRAYAANRPGGGCRFVLEVPAEGPSVDFAPSALLVGPRGDDLARAERACLARGWRVVRAERTSVAERRLAIEAPALYVVDGERLDAAALDAVLRARTADASVVVVRVEATARRDPRIDWELVSPVMEVELLAVMRAALSRESSRESRRESAREPGGGA